MIAIYYVLNEIGSAMNTLKVGDNAPLFELPNEQGEIIKLADFIGKTGQQVLVYFYPKAMTPGCTVQAQQLRDVKNELLAHNTIVFGISPDEPKRLAKFCQRDQLNFTLLSDVDHKIAEAFGVWVEKSMYGKKYMGIARTTFIINESGLIEDIIEKVNTKAHTTQILK